MKQQIYIYGIPGKVGGAATKIRHLCLLLKEAYNLFIVLPSKSWTKNKEVSSFLRQHGIEFTHFKQWKPKKNDTVLSVCELDFFTSGNARRLKERGCKVIWSNEMMWAFKGEQDAIRAGWIDKVLYVSDLQFRSLRETHAETPYTMVGNFVHPAEYPFRERNADNLTIGRLSRPDPMKYPEDFPLFYERLGLQQAKYRVMAWDQSLRKKFKWHVFDNQWDLLSPNQENACAFLQSLDLFVYPIGHRVQESWGRSTVESMLVGAIPIVPKGHHFEKLILQGETGFICSTYQEYKETVQRLASDKPFRRRMAAVTSYHAKNVICRPDQHLSVWREAFSF